MHFSKPNLLTVLAFAVIAMVGSCSCAARQRESGFEIERRPDAVRDTERLMADRVVRADQAVLIDRLAPERWSDLRADRTEPRRQWSEELPTGTTIKLQTNSLSSRATKQVRGQLQSSFFDQDYPLQAVVVWLNSDIQAPLMSEAQLKRWMQAIPEFDERTRNPELEAWRSDSRSQVRAASYLQPVNEGPLGHIGAVKKVEEFEERLKMIRELFESKKKQVATDESVDSSVKSELNSLVSLASDWLERATSDLETLKNEMKAEAEFKNNFQLQEQQLAREKKAASEKNAAKTELLPSDHGEALDVLQKKLKTKQVNLQALTDQRSEIREQMSDRDKRFTELPGLLRKNAKEESETKKVIQELEGQSDDLSRVLQKLLLDAKFLSLEITEESLELEIRRKEQIGRILPLKLEELTLRIKRMNAEISILSVHSDELRDRQIKDRLRAARMALNKKLTQSTPMLLELAEFNKDLAGQQTSLAVKSDELEKELINVRQLQKELDDSHERIKDQINTLGPTASGIRLVEHRRSLISTGKSQNRLLELAERMQRKQTRKLELKERVDRLVLEDDFKLDVLASVEEQVSDRVQRQMAVDVAEELLDTQRNYAMDLLSVYEDNIQKLSELEAAHNALIDKVQEVKAFSDENALWVRSARPFEINDLTICQTGMSSILASDQWQGLSDHAYATFQKRPYDVGLLALVIGTLLVVRRRLRWSHE